jgi:excisionase family DNA binding protein
MPDIRLLRLEEVAHRLGISYTQARMLILYEEEIPHFKVGARGIRVKEEDFEAYIAKQEQKKEEEKSGSEADTSGEPQDIREPYRGTGVLSEHPGRDEPPTVVKKAS